ncbi:MAG: hypothetical protein B7Z14_08475 [Bosea sp. 32-68-6]|nr:MAG: hypothetical protein B7Z14_08475 [Bosea sp. 32-68-6]
MVNPDTPSDTVNAGRLGVYRHRFRIRSPRRRPGRHPPAGQARLCEPSRHWRILVGKGVAESDFAALRQTASPNVTVERARADFPALLARSALSISQAGYNTVLDLVAAGRPAIVVPFDEGAETEQAIRAEAMERAGLARCLRLSGPEPARPADLVAAVTAALACEVPARPAIDLDGSGRIAGLLRRLLATQARG